MSDKIEVSKNFFLKQIVTELKSINEKLDEVDNVLYGNKEMHNEWEKIRQANLQVDDLIEELE